MEEAMRRRVVITGMGLVTPLGAANEVVWHNLLAGKSGIAPITLFDASHFPVRIAAEVRDWDLAEAGENPRRWQHCHRQTTFVIGAALKAARAAGLPCPVVDPLRFGVYLGCGEPFEDFHKFTKSVVSSARDGQCPPAVFSQAALRIFDPDAEHEFEPDMPGYHLAGLFNAQGPNANCIAACVSSTQAIGQAALVIRRGDADVMLAGGGHSTIHPFGVTGFHRLCALSQRNLEPESAVRPFDRDRDGFVIGEGAAIIVLEELEHARRRHADIWAELTGYGSSQDAFRVTDPRPDGSGASLAICRALRDAGLNTDAIDYVNAHGTGTQLNDKVETLAFKSALGADAGRTPISSTKSMLGHATTACGAIEAAICLLVIRHKALPPTINYHTPDPDCDLDYVPNQAREKACRHVLSNNIGFGGQNAALIVSRFDEGQAVSVSAVSAA
jgi:3-oxoacyl-[acyl-carrier-protein] synthase II